MKDKKERKLTGIYVKETSMLLSASFLLNQLGFPCKKQKKK